MTRHRRVLWLLSIATAALIVVCALALPTTPAHATVAVQNGKIAFESNRPAVGLPSGFSIYTVNPDGSSVSGPLVAESADITPSFSPDGTKIAWATYLYQYTSCGGAHSIAVMNADGSNPTLIANRCLDYGSVNGTEFNSPVWSPDGTRLAFMCTNPYTSGENVCLANSADDSGFVQLTGYANFDSVVHPTWSPDGSQIAYAVSTGGSYEVHVMNADGSNDHAITPTPQISWASDPAWSPDGTRIAFTGKDSDGHLRVFVMNPDGSSAVQLTPSGTNSDDKQAAWSPDGKEIAFASSRVTATYNIWTINADGSNLTPVTLDSQTNDEPNWGPLAPVGSPPDTAPPDTSIVLSSPNGGTPDGQNGWFVTGPVKGTVTADDSKHGGSNISGIDCGPLALTTTGIGTPTASGSFSIASEGVTHISCTATDSANNTSAPTTQDVELDSKPPILAPTVGPTPIGLGDHATATANATDAASGVASQSCDPVDTSTVGTHTLNCTATDNAGNQTTVPVSYTVGDDLSPDLTIVLSSPNGGTPDGQNGWFITGPVKGTVTADDSKEGDSNIVSLDCGSLTLTTISGLGTPTATGNFQINTDGVTSFNCTATDSSTNTDTLPDQIKLDTTNPSVSVTAPTAGGVYTQAQVVNAAYSCSDSGSGLASCAGPVASGAAIDTSNGPHSFTVRATDAAGNTASTTVKYTAAAKLASGTTTCNGYYNGTGSDLTIPPGAVCHLLAGTSITHDVNVKPGGVLVAQQISVGHDLNLTGAGGSSVCASSVTHDLNVQSSTGALVLIGDTAGGCSAGNTVGHDLNVLGNKGPVDIGKNTVAHDLTVQNNTPGGVIVRNNSAGYDAVCQGNNPQTGSGNKATHNNTCPA